MAALTAAAPPSASPPPSDPAADSAARADAADPPDYLSLASPLATASERAQLRAMREDIGAEALAPYADMPEVASDIALLRYLRGRDHDVSDAARVFRAHLAVRKEHDLDAVRARVLSASRDDNYSHRDFADGALCYAHMPVVYNAGRSREGHVYCYIPIGRQDSRAMWSEPGGFEKYFRFCVEEWVARDLQLTRLSRERGRLIKLILIIDLAGLSLTSSQVTHKAKKRFDKDWQAILETKPENTARWYFINTPWFGRKMFQALGKITFPANTLRKIELFGSDYRDALVGRVDLKVLSTLIRAEGGGDGGGGGDNGGGGAPLSGEIELKAGSAREIMVETDSSKHSAVQWSVRALTRDIGFCVRRYGGGGDNDAVEASVLRPLQIVQSSEGQVYGRISCQEGAGLLIFELSNKHSWMRGNRVEYAIEVVARGADVGDGAEKL